jgi:hypothetical protein
LRRITQLESFTETNAFTEAWSAVVYRREKEERHHRLGLVINLDDDDEVPGLSSRPRGRHGEAGQGCSSYLPQPKEEDPDDGEDYAAVMYRHLGLGRGNSS